MNPESAPRLEPEGPVRGLVVLIHGYGADGSDLIALGEAFAPALPGVAFVAPNAPEPCAAMPIGRQWFALTMRDPSEYWRGVSAAGPGLDRFIDGELERYGLTDDRLALVGFSQGAMMALYVGFRRAERIAGLIGYSGLLAGPEHLARDLRHRFPVLLVHGDSDDVVPVKHSLQANERLRELNVPVTCHVEPGLGHAIGPVGLEMGRSFLAEVLPAN
ncbi:alpha/beta hydrolase [Amorphus sp. 3PC139-8]|uniref:alpha/beta hydrolase n=1 Tax=Amorphus sp. 3PC139-8 TaxID=2735676 RepID=UPI00345D2B71